MRHIHLDACTCLCVRVRNIPTSISIYIYIFTSYLHIHIHTDTYKKIYICKCTYTHTHTHICMGDALMCKCLEFMRIHECVLGASQASHDEARPTRSSRRKRKPGDSPEKKWGSDPRRIRARRLKERANLPHTRDPEIRMAPLIRFFIAPLRRLIFPGRPSPPSRRDCY